MRFSRRHAFWTAVLFVIWLLLSESFNPLHMAVGLLASLAVSSVNAYQFGPRAHAVRWWKALWYFPWLFGRILLSGLHVSYLILHPRLPIKPQLFRHRTDLGHDSAMMLIGNSITLTPGTLTVEAANDELIVHAIDSESARDVKTGRLEAKVGQVFGPSEEGA